MNLVLLLAVTGLSVGAPPPEPAFDRALVERLIAAYKRLGPIEAPPLGGGEPLGLQTVLTSVTAHHPVLVAAAARLRQAQGVRLAAEGGFDPKLGAVSQLTPEGFYDVRALETKVSQPTPFWGVEVFAGYRIGRATNLASYDDRETLEDGEFKGGFVLPLLNGGPIDQRRADLRTSALGVEAALAGQAVDRMILALSGLEAYWKWVAAGESLRIVLALTRLAETRGQQVDEQVEAGAAPQIYRAENLRSLLKRREKLVSSTRKLEQSAIKLSLFFRNDNGEPQLPSSERLPAGVPRARMPDGDGVGPAMLRALDRRPDLQILVAQRDAARVSGELADNGILPRLDLELALSQDAGTDRDDKVQEALSPFEIKVNFRLEFPLLLRKGRGKAVQSWAKLAEAEAKLRFAQDKVRAQLEDVWSALRASARRVDVATQAADVAEAVAEGERARLQAGASSPFILNLREQAAADARLVEIEARADFQVSSMTWDMVSMRGLSF